MTTECRIWKTPAKLKSTQDYGNVAIISSPRAGGDYIIKNMAEIYVDKLDEAGRLKLTTWIVDQIRYGEPHPNVTPEVVDQIRNKRKLSVLERRTRLVQFLRRRLQDIGDDVEVAGKVTETMNRDKFAMLAWTESHDDREVRFLTETCIEEGLVEKTRNGNGIRLTANTNEH